MTTDGWIIELEPISQDPVKGPGEDQALLAFRGKQNKIRLGEPRVTDYLDDLARSGDPRPEDLADLAAAGYSILRVRPILTLLPDRGCKFTDVDFSIQFSGTLPDGTTAAERPLACEVRPAEITEELPFTRTARTTQEIGGEAGPEAGKLIAKLTRENAIQDKGSKNIRRVYGYGTGFYTAGWRFLATSASALEGDTKSLEVIVRVPHGATLSGRFQIAAHLTPPDRWLPRPFVPRAGNPILDVTYPLRP